MLGKATAPHLLVNTRQRISNNSSNISKIFHAKMYIKFALYLHKKSAYQALYMMLF